MFLNLHLENNKGTQHLPSNSPAQSLVHQATITIASKKSSTHSHHSVSHVVDITPSFTTEQTIANVSARILEVRKKAWLQKNNFYFIIVTVAVVIGMVMIAAALHQRITKNGYV